MTPLLAAALLTTAAVLPQTVASPSQQPPGRSAVEYRFHSAALDREMPYRVLLPRDYAGSDRRYPVLYLLHGLTGNYTNWTERTQLSAHAADLDLIVIMPDGGNSWYVNGPERWEDYIADDLVREVESRLRVDSKRESRFVAGLSMGGYGALKLGLRYPARYAIAASFSGALDVTRYPRLAWTEAIGKEFLEIFGPLDSRVRAQNDLLAIASAAIPAGLPFLYFDCGADDGLLKANRELAQILQERKIPYEYRETPGAHTWPYWDRQIREVLRMIEARTVSGRARPAA